MIARALYIIIIMIALPAWLLGLVLPLGWLVYSALCHAALFAGVPQPGTSLEYVWQLKLHASSLVLIFSASGIALLLAVVAAYAFARLGRAAVIWAAAAVLVVPPMVYGYLWYLTVGRHLPLPGLPSPLNLGVPNLPFARAGGLVDRAVALADPRPAAVGWLALDRQARLAAGADGCVRWQGVPAGGPAGDATIRAGIAGDLPAAGGAGVRRACPVFGSGLADPVAGPGTGGSAAGKAGDCRPAGVRRFYLRAWRA